MTSRQAEVMDVFFFAYLVYSFFSGGLINRIIGGPEPTLWKASQVILIGTGFALLTGMKHFYERLGNPSF